MTTGFVFGGAGTRGDFQVGAARLLYDRQIIPAVITGSSGGAIVALKLAEGGAGAAQEAEQLLRSLANSARVYTRQPWLAQLANTTSLAQRAVDWVSANGPGLAAVALPGLPLLTSPGFLTTATIATGGVALALEDIVSNGLVADGLFSAEPLRRLLAGNVDIAKVQSSGIRLRLAVAGVETAALRFVTERGQLLTLDRVDPTGDCAALQQQLDEARAEQARLNDELRDYVFTGSGPDPEYQALIRARNAATATAERVLRAQDAAGCRVDAGINLINAALASGAMPGYFPPVELAGELYVDGGLRSLLPIRAAVEAGADTIYAIYPKPDLTRQPIQGQAKMAQYLARAIDLMLEEVRMLETSHARQGAQVTLIQPSPGLMVHGDLVVEPGRSAISVGYGYMRASDVVDGAAMTDEQRGNLRRLSDLITRSRLACWNLEQFLFGTQTQNPGITDDPDVRPARVSAGDPYFLNVVRARKWIIAHLVAVREAAGGAVPEDVANWSHAWEPHDWEPPTAGPWEGYATSSTSVPAADFDTYTASGVAMREASSSEVFVIRGDRRFTVSATDVTSAVYPVEDGCLRYLQSAGALPPPPPPPADPCAGLRSEDLSLLEQLGRLSQELNALDPQADARERREIQATMKEVNAERDRVRQRQLQLGC